MVRRNPRHCLIPDYVLREIARRGGEAEREAALDSLGISATLRSARMQAEARGGLVRLPAAALRPPKIDRVIRNANGGTDLTAPVVRREGDQDSGDPAVDEAFEHFGSTWSFFFEALARNTIDNAGMTLDGVVHYGRNFDNAFWDGDQMVFGDGSGRLFTRLTQSLSVCAHELGHGVIQFDGPLVYQGQSGALNEHIADAFGVMVHQWKHRQTVTEADWLVGAEILAAGVNGDALRSLKQPGTAYDDDTLGKDPQPAHMDGYVHTADDNGGVHINSGIPNKAFYEIASTLGGNSWDRAGRILYATLGHPQLRPTSNFRQFARLNHRVAVQMYGADSVEAAAVETGWTAVGITV
ncbi:MAG: M4 family metallopeptidase [Actinomycetota bacterium]|nr:M4 family metallopeptidase [Actinomycetota bacterium]